MSEKEKELAMKIAGLPAELQQQFADQVEGAVKALDIMRRETTDDNQRN